MDKGNDKRSDSLKKLMIIVSALFLIFAIFSIVCFSLSGPKLSQDFELEKIKLNDFNFKLEWRCKD